MKSFKQIVAGALSALMIFGSTAQAGEAMAVPVGKSVPSVPTGNIVAAARGSLGAIPDQFGVGIIPTINFNDFNSVLNVPDLPADLTGAPAGAATGGPVSEIKAQGAASGTTGSPVSLNRDGSAFSMKAAGNAAGNNEAGLVGDIDRLNATFGEGHSYYMDSTGKVENLDIPTQPYNLGSMPTSPIAKRLMPSGEIATTIPSQPAKKNTMTLEEAVASADIKELLDSNRSFGLHIYPAQATVKTILGS